MRLAVLASLLLVTSACSDDDQATTSAASTTGAGAGGNTSQGGGASTGGMGGTASTGGAGGGTCDDPPLVPVAEDAGLFLGAFTYVAQNTLSSPVDVLNFELVGDTPDAGAITLNDDNYDTCVNCVSVFRGCDDNLANCTSTLLADSGTLNITSVGNSGATFAGTLENAHFVEVTIDPNNHTSTAVPNGETQCWATYSFSATIQ